MYYVIDSYMLILPLHWFFCLHFLEGLIIAGLGRGFLRLLREKRLDRLEPKLQVKFLVFNSFYNSMYSQTGKLKK
jgi:hypothetical protein